MGSQAGVSEARQWLDQQPTYQQLARSWDSLDEAGRRGAMVQLEELMRAAAYATRPLCLRCGQCCVNAGPTLHQGDQRLLRRGLITRSQLITLRKGEQVYSHHRSQRVTLEHEVVMIRPAPQGSCRFYLTASRSCSIHEQRPRQCRAQRCWDTTEADELMDRAGLTRLDLLEAGDPLRAIIEEHDRVCCAASLRQLVAGAEPARPALELMLARDQSMRRELVEGDPRRQTELPFLLGRPLEALLRRFAD